MTSQGKKGFNPKKALLFLTPGDHQKSGDPLTKGVRLSYQIFGRRLGEAPVVLVNHALTGNSDVCSPEKGWWKSIIGEDKLIDTNQYTVLAFNIPGNGYDGQLIENYQSWSVRDIAELFIAALDQLDVKRLHAVIGGSLGGGIAWEMAVLAPDLIRYVIPVASDWKASDWVLAHNYVQQSLLKNSKNPLQDARKMAMLFYRTPASFLAKFNRSKVGGKNEFNVISWLRHHGEKLERRFDVKAYLLMNHLLSSLDITDNRGAFIEVASEIKSTVIQIGVDTDFFFTAENNRMTQKQLNNLRVKNYYFEIESIHGHDAFLIESNQITNFLTPFFK